MHEVERARRTGALQTAADGREGVGRAGYHEAEFLLEVWTRDAISASAAEGLMIEQVAVIVPAADEQERIAACLAAIHAARDGFSRADLGVRRVDVIVVLDGCRDRLASWARYMR